MLADQLITNQENQTEDTQGLCDQQIKNITDAYDTHIQQIDLELQDLLCQILQTKLYEYTLKNVQIFLKKVNPKLIVKVTKGTQMISALYQVLELRKSSILRNHPFSPIQNIMILLKKLMKHTQKLVLKQFGLQIRKTQEKKEKFQEQFKQQYFKCSSFQPYTSNLKILNDSCDSLTRQISFDYKKDPVYIYRPVFILQNPM